MRKRNDEVLVWIAVIGIIAFVASMFVPQVRIVEKLSSSSDDYAPSEARAESRE